MVTGNDAVQLPLGTARGHTCQYGAKGHAWTSSRLFASQTKDPLLGNTASKYPKYEAFFGIRKMLGEKNETYLPKQAGPWVFRTLESQCLCNKPR